MIKIGKKNIGDLNFGDSKKILQVYKGHVKIFPKDDAFLQQYIVPDGKWNVGDVVLWDKASKKMIVVNIENVDRFSKHVYSPVGVVVIPQSHNVYGDNSAGVISLHWMSFTSPENGTYFPNSMVFGYSGINYSNYFSKRTSYPTLGSTSSNPKDNYYTTISNGYGIMIPSDNFNNTQYPLNKSLYYDNHNDSYYLNYGTIYWGISPFNEDGSKNEDFSRSSGTLNFFDGKELSEKWLSFAKNDDWKTGNLQILSKYNSEVEGIYLPVMCCWRYHTEGTNQGDWYLPSIEELIYFKTWENKINQIIAKLFKYYFNCSYISTSIYNEIYSSTFGQYVSGKNSINVCSIDFVAPLCSTNNNIIQYGILKALYQLKTQKKKYKLTLKFNKGISEIKVMINGVENSYKNEIELDVYEGSKVSWEIILTSSLYYSDELFGEIESFDGDYTIDITPNMVDADSVIVEKGKEVAGEVVLWDRTEQKKIITNVDVLELFDKDRYIPIGIVAIPSSQNVYGDGSGSMLSLKKMSLLDPDNGCLDYEGTFDRYDGYSDNPIYGYTGDTLGTTVTTSSAAQNLFNQDAVNAKIIASSPGYDWKTSAQIQKSTAKGNYPAGFCCWRYHTEGTKQGDWYFPSIGEIYKLFTIIDFNIIFKNNDSILNSLKNLGYDTKNYIYMSSDNYVNIISCSESRYDQCWYYKNLYISQTSFNIEIYSKAVGLCNVIAFSKI